MKLSKATTNFAAKRGFDLTIEEANGEQFLAVWEADNDCEWMLTYFINNDGSFTFKGNVYLIRAIKEELPATIRDEKHLREVLVFIAAEMDA